MKLTLKDPYLNTNRRIQMTNENLQKLVGKTIVELNCEKGRDFVAAKTDCGLLFEFYNDDYGSVHLEDITGDIDDLIGTPIIMVEEVTNREEISDTSVVYNDDTHTWTFYRLESRKGLVVLRFFGTSNGYYSESVTIDITDLKLN